MAQADILREFLVKLGYKVDEASQRRFAEGVERMTDRVKDLAKAAVVMGTAVGVAVVKVASDLDNLYFASKRIGASAGNIRAFEFAIKQMGGSGEAARAALEGLARFMRNSPGAEGFLAGLGIKTRDANGNLRDTVQIYTELAGVLKGMDSSQANAVAQVLGLDDNTLQAIRSGDLKAYMADYLATLDKLGIKQDEAAENAAKFSRGLEEVKTIAGLLVEKYSVKLIDFFQQVGERIGRVSDVVSETPFGSIWADEIEILSGHLKTVVGWLDKAWVLIKNISGAAWDGWKEKVSDSLGGTNAGGFIGMMAAKIAASFGNKEALSALQRNGDISAPPKASGAVGASGPAAPTDKRSAAMAFFRKMGWSQAQAAGIVANLMSESGLEPSAVGDNGQAFGIGQWHPDRQANFRRWAGKDIRQSSLQEQLAFVQYELTQGAEQRAGAMLLASRNAQDAGSVVSRFYERPLSADAEASKRGALAMQIANTTTIHVSGSSDPMATAQAVASLQVQTSQDMTRNLRGAMQ